MRKCNRCHKQRKHTFKDRVSRRYYNGKVYEYQRYICRVCRRAKLKRYVARNPEKWKAYIKQHCAARRLRALTHYSGGAPLCKCCGEPELSFLVFDHINNGGTAHRRLIGKSGTRFVDWLIQNNFPDGYQVLCHNCNWGKRLNPVCPHKRLDEESRLTVGINDEP